VPPFLTSALDDDWSALRHGQFTHGERHPVLILYKVVWPHNQSGHCREEKLFPCRKSNPDRSELFQLLLFLLLTKIVN
jgi:hypothetical protein